MNKIKWEKWKDPFDKEMASPSYSDNEKQGNDVGPVVYGEFGVVPVGEAGKPGKLFNFWVGHTNFSITPKLRDIIKNIDGVEILNIFTRYRLRVGVGMVFDHKIVLEKINVSILPEKIAKQNSFQKIKHHLEESYDYWAIASLANGEMDCKHGNTIKEVEDGLKNYPSGTPIIKSWEESDARENQKAKGCK